MLGFHERRVWTDIDIEYSKSVGFRLPDSLVFSGRRVFAILPVQNPEHFLIYGPHREISDC